VRVGAELRHRDAFLPQLAGVADIPLLKAQFGDLWVELKGEGVPTHCECLIFIELGASKMESSSGEVEGVAVPMEHMEIPDEERGKPGGGWLRAGLDREPADFRAVRPGVDSCTESRDHELGSKADAQSRPVRREAPAKRFDFCGHVRVIAGVINADGSAHDDEQIGVLGLRQGKTRSRQVDGLDRKAAPVQYWPQRTEILEGKVGENDSL